MLCDGYGSPAPSHANESRRETSRVGLARKRASSRIAPALAEPPAGAGAATQPELLMNETGRWEICLSVIWVMGERLRGHRIEGRVVSLRRLRSLLRSLVPVLVMATIVLSGMPWSIAPPAGAGDQQSGQRQDVIVVLKRGA